MAEVIVYTLMIVGLVFLIGHSLTAIINLYVRVFALVLSFFKIKVLFIEFAVSRLRGKHKKLRKME